MKELKLEKATAATLLGTDAIWAATFEEPGKIIDDSAVAKRDELLETSENIEQVINDDTNQMAADQLKAIQKMLSQTEKDRKGAKKPFDEVGKRITAEAREFCSPLEIEKKRLQTMMNGYHQEQLRKQREAEAEARRKQEALEAEKQAALAKQKAEMENATDMNQVANAAAEAELTVGKIEQQQNEAAAAVPQAQAASGTAAVEEWMFEIEDLEKVFMNNRDLLDIKPRIGLIKQRLKAGQKIEGIKAWTESRVRATGR